MIGLKPVNEDAAETPMSPVMAEDGTVEMPALQRILNLAALPKATGPGPTAMALEVAFEQHTVITVGPTAGLKQH